MRRITTSSGLEYSDVKICGGPRVQDGDQVLLLYKAALREEDLDAGKYLESTYTPEIPVEVRVLSEELLPGVYEGVRGMRSGGSIRRLYLPPELAYGSRGWGAVPPSSELIVDVCVTLVTERRQGASVDRT